MYETHGQAKWWVVSGLALLLATLACNGDVTSPTPLPTAPTGQPMGETTPLPPPAVTDTPAPDVTTEAGCTLNGAFVADVTVPDNSEFPPGASFTKTWRVRNSGTCAWEAGTILVFISGDQLGGPSSVPVAAVASGSTTDVSVGLVAPPSPGTYKGNWQLQTPDGTRFGSAIYVQIVVPPPFTDTPEATDTLEPGETPTTSPTTPDVPPPFAAVWDALGNEGGSLGTPIGEAATDRWAADLRFEHGAMYWRNNEGVPANHVYVLYYQGGTDETQGSWERYVDTWEEGMDEVSCPEADPTNGPIRGFGKVWCDNPDVRLDVGEATEPEQVPGFQAGFQDFEEGTLLWTRRLHFIYAVFEDGTWQRFDETP
jgi:hypothetical protein